MSLPLRWERVLVEEPKVDERLWFDAPCGRRDFLVGKRHIDKIRVSGAIRGQFRTLL